MDEEIEGQRSYMMPKITQLVSTEQGRNVDFFFLLVPRLTKNETRCPTLENRFLDYNEMTLDGPQG